jgi:glycosyltransferase involved in cell wall biosynthesis
MKNCAPNYIIITPFFPSPKSWRGAYVLDQVKAIQHNADYEVMVFKPGTEDYEIEGIRVYGFKTLQTRSFLFEGIFDSINARHFLKRVKELGINIHAIKFVHCHTAHLSACGLVLKKISEEIKVLTQHHNLDPFAVRNGLLSACFINSNYRSRSSMKLFREVDLHVCISEPCRDNLLAFPNPRNEELDEKYLSVLRTIKGVKPLLPKSVYVLNNGVDLTIFKPRVGMKHSDIFRIGCIANFLELKGHMTLLKAFQLLVNKGYKDMRLTLLGTGPTRLECEDFARKTGISSYIEWPQEVSHECLPDYYHSLDLYAMPSSFEGFGCVYTEAAACGVPFVGCYNNGAAECITPEERDKWLIAPGDYVKLAEIIERQYLYRDSQHLCKSYDIDCLVSQYLDYLSKV